MVDGEAMNVPLLSQLRPPLGTAADELISASLDHLLNLSSRLRRQAKETQWHWPWVVQQRSQEIALSRNPCSVERSGSGSSTRGRRVQRAKTLSQRVTSTVDNSRSCSRRSNERTFRQCLPIQDPYFAAAQFNHSKRPLLAD
jgi:hypothetical protein